MGLRNLDRDLKQLVAMMKYKSSARKKTAVVPVLRCTDEVVLLEFGTQQIRQVLLTSMEALLKPGRIIV